jgi:hypothetical protein
MLVEARVKVMEGWLASIRHVSSVGSYRYDPA